LARECLSIREETSPDDWETFNARSLLGGVLSQGKYEAAEPLLLSSYEGMNQRQRGAWPPELEQAVQRLVNLYEAWGKPVQAAEWKQKLAEPKQTVQ